MANEQVCVCLASRHSGVFYTYINQKSIVEIKTSMVFSKSEILFSYTERTDFFRHFTEKTVFSVSSVYKPHVFSSDNEKAMTTSLWLSQEPSFGLGYTDFADGTDLFPDFTE